MLILTRRVSEEIRIGDSISLKILGIRGSQIRVGINAPSDISVHREEIYQRILAEKQQKTISNNIEQADDATNQ